MEPKNARVFLGDTPRHDRARQLDRCRKAVANIEGVPELEAVYESHEFDCFVRDLRYDEIAVLPRLIVIDQRPVPKGTTVGARFARRHGELERACLYILDVDADLRSTDEPWTDHVESRHNAIVRGRKLSSPAARKNAKKKNKRHPGVVKHWKDLEGTKAHTRLRQHWTDPKISTAEEAIATAPDIAGALRECSRSTWERVFGGRTQKPAKKRAARRKQS